LHHTSGGNNLVVKEIPGKEFLLVNVTFNKDFIPFGSVTGILERFIPESGPEERYPSNWNLLIEHIKTSYVSLIDSFIIMFDSCLFTRNEIWERSNITCSKNIGVL